MGFALGIELDGEGFHPEAWRRAHHAPERLLTAETLRTRVEAAENAGFTLATFADSILPPGELAGRIDAVTRASFVAATTSTIGLVPTVATTYAEPFHLSSQIATLDYASRGRAGWIAERIDDPRAAAAWGRPPVLGDDELAREQRDSIEVARRLWDSWEDDAVIRDYSQGRFLDRNRLHYIDFEGAAYSVKGPAIVPRPPQGQPVVFGADGAVDVRLIPADSVETAIEQADSARAAGAPLAFAEIEVTLDTPAATAVERFGAATPNSPARLAFSGTAAELIDLLTRLSGHLDGVRLHPAVIDEDLPVLVRAVLPALLRTGVTHRPVPGSTLRANLGLPRPANRYAASH
ncbi:alkanesulfonate monooxygenase SsuD/methylene tetrahydromethanopterin reductase-like flavin-dependent oxidoreductase (luciferase family) [Nocardia tenerifensis]|uniref:Alkanesulfonate monooxygenase SsuD/methylene tetrahydromethanopterin reductase-like flavin-dependent oxidoreductase (Luciferase family) n=1 Tax=Nocardia tenerifensis TaxID=228006 RepID=A0A318KXW1_9NOCA|nr:LLM class flavin-dependent oxidoreductase [Nocardia tenerifensis]PXX70754.1 alkanesulfonate monooxygenase SsuD/methylene tetrahydromethanopterin reductase-like flavin-dependent oxidoreductase (luciferase family) [Nocardia tenerifensis]